MTPFPRIKFRLQNGMSNFVRRRGTREPYPSQPSRPPFKFDALKCSFFLSTRNEHFHNKLWYRLRETHIFKKTLGGTNYIHKLPINRPSGRYVM